MKRLCKEPIAGPNSTVFSRKIGKALACQRQRCNNPRNPDYKTYGAKGIRVEYGLVELFQWAESLNLRHKKEKWVIGRIDHSKNYSINNIEVQTPSENSKERMSRAGNPFDRKPCFAIEISSGFIVGEWESALDAEKETGIHNAQISRQIKRPPSKPRTKIVFFEGRP